MVAKYLYIPWLLDYNATKRPWTLVEPLTATLEWTGVFYLTYSDDDNNYYYYAKYKGHFSNQYSFTNKEFPYIIKNKLVIPISIQSVKLLDILGQS